MSMYTVEIKAGTLTDNVNIHSWIYVTKPDGQSEAWGFYPAESGLSGLNGSGDVRDDRDSESNASSGPMQISEAQYNLLMDYIQRTDANPPPYSILFGSQCTSWVLAGLAEAGIIPSILGPAMEPNNILWDFMETLIWNPIWQKIGFDVSDFFTAARSEGSGL